MHFKICVETKQKKDERVWKVFDKSARVTKVPEICSVREPCGCAYCSGQEELLEGLEVDFRRG